ncbi:nucleotide-binding universal stress UspA family protein [Desulfobaculum xiamenense]|uniref:Universal stress protein n=1 Tax=Desulfobaculum xiamenense TaxID=995050 RepID=A0A846QIY3_9BACT|nr:universal stress protein [Desulfobaculum xiamenense]NJB68198.1 nucleotide-binding universal stress UspA family protein [Desulfobaculum xiamenense]
MPTIRRILCAIDFSEHSPIVADYALALAKSTGAELTVLYAAPSFDQYLSFDVPLTHIEDLVGGIMKGAAERMRAFVAERFPGMKVTPRVTAGYPAQEILGEARNMSADLIVIGTHGRQGVDRIIFGSVAEKVVRSSFCPVLTVRPRAV